MSQASVDSSRPDTRGRYLSLDVWRGLACLMVAAGHASRFGMGAAMGKIAGGGETWVWLWSNPLVFLMSKGWIGVPMFFVISGYCITATSEYSRDHGRSVGEFIRRRIRRIYPPYWLMVAVLAIVLVGGRGVAVLQPAVTFLPSPSALPWDEWIGNLTLTATWLNSASPRGMLNTVAWTLCYEEQFYFVCALLLAVSPRRYFLATGLMTLAVVLLNRCAAAVGVSRLLTGTFLDGRWLQFAIGVGLYHLLNRQAPPRRRGAVLGLIAALAATVLLQVGFPRVREPLLGNPVFELQVCLAFCLVLILAHPYDVTLYRFRWLGPLRHCGRICYSLYLVHLPVVLVAAPLLHRWGLRSLLATVFLAVPLAVLLAVLLASLFFVACERPFLNTPRGPALKGTTRSPRYA